MKPFLDIKHILHISFSFMFSGHVTRQVANQCFCHLNSQREDKDLCNDSEKETESSEYVNMTASLGLRDFPHL